MTSDSPIVVLDSGLGGLTVAREIRSRRSRLEGTRNVWRDAIGAVPTLHALPEKFAS
jgi:hypothetical protein